MSDGPHRSLNMRRGWKRFAERADKKAYAVDEVCAALPKALEQDWRAEIPKSLCKRIRESISPEQGSLFSDSQLSGLRALRRQFAGSPLASVLLDCVSEAIGSGLTGEDALTAAATNALSDRAARGARQVEEHFRRKSTEPRATHVRERLEQGIAAADINALARRLLGPSSKNQVSNVSKQTGLDDGVRLR